MIKPRPVRYRSRTTGRFVSEDFARDHPEETYVVGSRGAVLLLVAGSAGLLVLAMAAGILYRSRR